MNTYSKYLPNVWLAKCQTEHNRGDIIPVANKYGKESDCEVHNLIVKNANGYFYSVTRCDGLNRQTYAERKAKKYAEWAKSAEAKSDAFFSKSQNGREFLSLGEPIKVGHHSENRHRKLIEKNWAAIGKSVEQSEKAKSHTYKSAYWESQSGRIDLSMPESIEYYTHELEKFKAEHLLLKSDPSKRQHSMALSYASKRVKDTSKLLDNAKILWANNET